MENNILNTAHKRMILYFRSRPDRAAEMLLGQTLLPIQRILLFAAWFYPFVFMIIARGGGKTFILALVTILRGLLYSRQRIGIIASSFRQCLVRDSMMFTNSGLVTVGELAKDPFIDAHINIPVQTIEGSGVLEGVHAGNITLNRLLKLKYGFEIEGAKGHLIWDGNGYVKLSDLKVGDSLPIDITPCFSKTNFEIKFSYIHDSNHYNDCNIPVEVDSDLAEYLGYLIGDGCMLGKCYAVIFTTKDSVLKDRYLYLANKLFKLKANVYIKKNGVMQIVIQNKKLKEFLIYCGVAMVYAYDKSIPYVVRVSTKKSISAFIGALYSTDGCIYKGQSAGNHKIHYATTSKVLASQLQMILLNFGIIASRHVIKRGVFKKFKMNGVISFCRDIYQVEIKSTQGILTFKESIQLKLDRKQNKLLVIGNLIESNERRHPVRKCYVKNPPMWLFRVIRSELIEADIAVGPLNIWARNKKNVTKGYIVKFISYCETHDFSSSSLDELKEYFEAVKNTVWVDISEIKKTKGLTHDFYVPGQENYKANGFYHHNSKLVFNEVRRIYAQSTILKDCCIKDPVQGTDMCYLHLKNGSELEAIPLGDGNKIRGSRYFFLVLDERAQIPKDIIDKVIIGMTATVQDPVFNVARVKILKKYGVDIALYKKEATENHILSASTAFYQFNHLWDSITSTAKIIQEKKMADGKPIYKAYALVKAAYTMYPEGFMNMATIEHARETMSELEFAMEYKAFFPPESGGFFPPQIVLNAVSLKKESKVLVRGREGRRYILCIDPARNSANCAYAILELDNGCGFNLVVYVDTMYRQKFERLTYKVWSLLKQFNIIQIIMDAGGGGREIKDLLSASELCPPGSDLIYDPEDELSYEDERKLIPRKGLHILKMIDFTSQFLYEANHALKASFERQTCVWPRPLDSDDLKCSEEEAEMLEEVENQIRKTKLEILSIIATATAKGYPTWIPAKKSQRVDRYDAVMMGNWYIKQIAKDIVEKNPELPIGGWQKEAPPEDLGITAEQIIAIAPEASQQKITDPKIRDKKKKKLTIYESIALTD